MKTLLCLAKDLLSPVGPKVVFEKFFWLLLLEVYHESSVEFK